MRPSGRAGAHSVFNWKQADGSQGSASCLRLPATQKLLIISKGDAANLITGSALHNHRDRRKSIEARPVASASRGIVWFLFKPQKLLQITGEFLIPYTMVEIVTNFETSVGEVSSATKG